MALETERAAQLVTHAIATNTSAMITLATATALLINDSVSEKAYT